jgi:Holliday junction resolvase RusA-like endonuclease
MLRLPLGRRTGVTLTEGTTDRIVLCAFGVIGVPAPQGSKRAFVVAGKARMTDMGGKGAVAWRDSVAAAALAAATSTPFDGPLGLDVIFRFPMPASRPKRTQNAGKCLKTTAPDSSKLLRALEDGLQAGGLIKDDARLCRHTVRKYEVVGWTGAIVRLTREVEP